MVDEFPTQLADQFEYSAWIEVLAEASIGSARGQAIDADYTGDLADTPESRIEYAVELEADDKLDALSEERAPYDVLRFTDQKPTQDILDTLTSDKTVKENALQLAFDALFQDVLTMAANTIEPE